MCHACYTQPAASMCDRFVSRRYCIGKIREFLAGTLPNKLAKLGMYKINNKQPRLHVRRATLPLNHMWKTEWNALPACRIRTEQLSLVCTNSGKNSPKPCRTELLNKVCKTSEAIRYSNLKDFALKIFFQDIKHI